MVKGTKPIPGLSKAHHFGFTYDWNINQSLHLKIEPYYQYLFHIPVEELLLFDYQLRRILFRPHINKHRNSQNYGIDITLEQYMKNGFYYMITVIIQIEI